MAARETWTPLVERFCAEYLADPTNATAAAIRAGYSAPSAKQYASLLLKRPDVAARVEEDRAALRDRCLAKRERLIEEIAKVAFASIATTLMHDGTPVPWSQLSAADRAAVRRVKRVRGKTHLQYYDKLKAMELLAKVCGYGEMAEKGPERVPVIIQIPGLKLA